MKKEQEIAKEFIKILDDKKVEDISCIMISEALPKADYFIIGTVQSSHQVSAIVKEAEDLARKFNFRIINRHATEQNGWFLLDFDIVIIHLFTPEMREYYQLENLWKKYAVNKESLEPLKH